MRTRLKQEWAFFNSAVMFYTRFPTQKSAPHSDQILNRSRKYFPLVGIVVGGLSGLIFVIASQWLSTSVSIVIMMLASIFMTGAFHEDGFADSCDGFGGGWSAEHVLTIMKDSRLGTYGTVGLFGVLLLKFSILTELSQLAAYTFVWVSIAAHAMSRQVSSVMIELYDYVQDIDKSKVKPITDQRLNLSDSAVSIGTTVAAVAVLFIFAPLACLLALLCALGAGLGFAAYSKKRIGGYTGDVLGAIQQMAEVSFYIGLALIL